MKVKGEISSQIEIRDDFNNSTTFIHNLLVISNLRHNILIGQDILTSRVYATTQEAIIFNKIPGKTYNTSRIKYNPNYIIVSFVKNNQVNHSHREIANMETSYGKNGYTLEHPNIDSPSGSLTAPEYNVCSNSSEESPKPTTKSEFRDELDRVLKNYSIDEEEKDKYIA